MITNQKQKSNTVAEGIPKVALGRMGRTSLLSTRGLGAEGAAYYIIDGWRVRPLNKVEGRRAHHRRSGSTKQFSTEFTIEGFTTSGSIFGAPRDIPLVLPMARQLAFLLPMLPSRKFTQRTRQ